MITTYTGKTVNPLDLKPDDICIEDIAHSLALINRFNGHSRFPISVAQHSVYVSRLSKGHELQGLLHDAAEAYLGDMTKWLKQEPEMQHYRLKEDIAQDLIFEVFGCDFIPAQIVNEADDIMVRFEAEKTFGPGFFKGPHQKHYPPITKEERERIGNWQPWKWTTAEEIFLAEFRSLT